MTDKLPPPPGICDECFCHQSHHSLDTGGDIYFCAHNNCLAIPKSDLSGWIIETGIDSSEWLRRADVAERTLDLLGADLKTKH